MTRGRELAGYWSFEREEGGDSCDEAFIRYYFVPEVRS